MAAKIAAFGGGIGLLFARACCKQGFAGPNADNWRQLGQAMRGLRERTSVMRLYRAGRSAWAALALAALLVTGARAAEISFPSRSTAPSKGRRRRSCCRSIRLLQGRRPQCQRRAGRQSVAADHPRGVRQLRHGRCRHQCADQVPRRQSQGAGQGRVHGHQRPAYAVIARKSRRIAAAEGSGRQEAWRPGRRPRLCAVADLREGQRDRCRPRSRSRISVRRCASRCWPPARSMPSPACRTPPRSISTTRACRSTTLSSCRWPITASISTAAPSSSIPISRPRIRRP